MNLILAAIMDSFDKVDKKQVFEEIKKDLNNVVTKITSRRTSILTRKYTSRKSLSKNDAGGEGVD